MYVDIYAYMCERLRLREKQKKKKLQIVMAEAIQKRQRTYLHLSVNLFQIVSHD